LLEQGKIQLTGAVKRTGADVTGLIPLPRTIETFSYLDLSKPNSGELQRYSFSLRPVQLKLSKD
jgi:ribosomal protein S10